MKTRFYFHLTIGDLRLLDRFGGELSPEEVMTPAALVLAKEIWPGLCDSDVWADWSVEVVDTECRVVRVIALLD